MYFDGFFDVEYDGNVSFCEKNFLSFLIAKNCFWFHDLTHTNAEKTHIHAKNPEIPPPSSKAYKFSYNFMCNIFFLHQSTSVEGGVVALKWNQSYIYIYMGHYHYFVPQHVRHWYMASKSSKNMGIVRKNIF